MRKLITLMALVSVCVAFARDYDWTFDKSARTADDIEVSTSWTEANAEALTVFAPLAEPGEPGNLDTRQSFAERFGDFVYWYRKGLYLWLR